MKVNIVGAGLGGLTLGNLLRQADPTIQVQIFERDASPHSRSQGYSLTLREPGGLTPLRRLGFYDELRSVSRAVVNFPFVSSTGKTLMNLRDNPASPRTLRVSRDTLREVLLRDLESHVQFATPCLGYAERKGIPVVRFAGGREESADLVVACDGVHSAIRQQMIGDQAHYLGISALAGAVSPASNHPLLTDGSLFMVSNGAGVFVVNEGDVTAWSLSLRARQDAFEVASKVALKERAMMTTRGWHSPIPDIISQTDPNSITVSRYYDQPPVVHARRGHIVLLGDAAHSMTPFRGEGANMAMLDALSLTSLLTAPEQGRLDDILDRYQKEMLGRSRKAVVASRNAALDIHTKNPFRQAIRNTTWRMVNRILPLVQRGEEAGTGKWQRRNTQRPRAR